MKAAVYKKSSARVAAIITLAVMAVCITIHPVGAAARQRWDASDGPYKYQIIDDITLTDEARHRDIPLRIYCPDAPGMKSPVILVSHGIGGSKTTGNWVGKFLATHGYICVFMTHYGSDTSLLDLGAGFAENIKRLQKAVNAESIINRPLDVTKVIDSLGQIQKNAALNGRMDLNSIGVTGHSFGAFTTMAVSGAFSEQFNQIAGKTVRDGRPNAFLAMSPQGVRRNVSAERTFAGVKRPTMIMTGSRDVDPIMPAQTAESRMDAYKHMPAGDKYALWIEGAQHHTFGDGRGAQVIDPFMRKITKIAMLAFWDAYLKNDEAARDFLISGAIEKIGEGKIKFYRK